MSAKHHSISIHFIRTLVASAKRNGIDHQKLLQFAGVNESLLSNEGLRVTPDQLSRMMQELWREADDEFMCMGSQPSKHGIFTLMAKQAVRCKNLHAVYHHLGHFYNLVAPALKLNFTITENEVRFSFSLTDPEIDQDKTLREFLLLLWHRFPSWLIGQLIPLKYATLDFPEPSHSAEHRLMYPCTMKYNQPSNMLVFDAKLLNESVVQTPVSLSAYLRRAPLDWFKRQAYYPVFTRRVMDYLEREKELANTHMDEIAKELHLTSRTLRRKLDLEGTSFQELKDDVRRDAAIHYLSQPSTPISEISRKLGFSEPAAFTRAFKQWTGVAPGIYRRG
jgi:AraC-like DNA-binding protein